MPEYVTYTGTRRTVEGFIRRKEYERARQRAYRRLSRLHNDDFKQLVAEEYEAAKSNPHFRVVVPD